MDQDILIYERSTEKYVTAKLHDDVSTEQLAQAESQWRPFREAAIARLFSHEQAKRDAAIMIQHGHWDWLKKAQTIRKGMLGIRCFGVTSGGQWQGLAMLNLAAHTADLGDDKGKPLVYVEFLESAPWNLNAMCDEPRYGLIGVRLMEAAVRLSIEEGFYGRVSLLALPQAEPFYERCLMTHVDGRIRFGMKLYEMTRNNAVTFLGE
jgi:GNAT superfamily N-acetyltransferase